MTLLKARMNQERSNSVSILHTILILNETRLRVLEDLQKMTLIETFHACKQTTLFLNNLHFFSVTPSFHIFVIWFAVMITSSSLYNQNSFLQQVIFTTLIRENKFSAYNLVNRVKDNFRENLFSCIYKNLKFLENQYRNF